MTARDIALSVLPDAYSGARYGEAAFIEAAEALAERGYTNDQVRAVLLSSHMRHAADQFAEIGEGGVEVITGREIDQFISCYPAHFTAAALARLVG